MAKIPVYDAADREIHTEREGFAAEETAGRRIGPAFDKAATDVRDIGNVSAAIFKQRLWPWDILELQQNNTGEARGVGRGRGGSGGGGARIEGGVNNLVNSHLDAGATGRLGNVAAAAAQHFNGTPIAKTARVQQYGDPAAAGGDLDPSRSRVINDNRKMTPGNFPEKVSPGLENRFDPNKDPNATTWPKGLEEQPANPEFLRREAEQQVFRENTFDDFGGGFDSPQEASSFPSSVWEGVKGAASWLGNAVSSANDQTGYEE